MTNSLTVYGDPSNRTICVRGATDSTNWATVCCPDDDDFDVVVVSDGTVIGFYFLGDKCTMKLVAKGKALVSFREDLEAVFCGDIAWALTGVRTDMAWVDGAQ